MVDFNSFIMIHDATVYRYSGRLDFKTKRLVSKLSKRAWAVFWKVAVGTPTGTVPMSGNGNTRFGLIYNFRN
jgi:hypothetical protein